jgi:hypothetical protein
MSNVENGRLYGHLGKIDFDRQVSSHEELLESYKRTCKSYQLFMASSNMRLLLPGRQAIDQKTQNDRSDTTVARALSVRSPAGMSGVTRGGQPLVKTANVFKRSNERASSATSSHKKNQD